MPLVGHSYIVDFWIVETITVFTGIAGSTDLQKRLDIYGGPSGYVQRIELSEGNGSFFCDLDFSIAICYPLETLVLTAFVVGFTHTSRTAAGDRWWLEGFPGLLPISRAFALFGLPDKL